MINGAKKDLKSFAKFSGALDLYHQSLIRKAGHFVCAQDKPSHSGVGAPKGETGKAGLLGPASESKLWKQRGMKKKSSSLVQEDSSPDNTRWVAPDDLEANFVYRDIRMRQKLFFLRQGWR